MHRVQKLASDSGHIYARDAETRLRFRAYLCPGCRNMPQIQGILMPGVHKRVPDLGHINELSKWFALNLGQHIARWAIYALRKNVV